MLHCAVCGRGGSALETGSGSLAERTLDALDRVALGHVGAELGQDLLDPGVEHVILDMYLWIFLQGHVDSVNGLDTRCMHCIWIRVPWEFCGSCEKLMV